MNPEVAKRNTKQNKKSLFFNINILLGSTNVWPHILIKALNFTSCYTLMNNLNHDPCLVAMDYGCHSNI